LPTFTLTGKTLQANFPGVRSLSFVMDLCFYMKLFQTMGLSGYLVQIDFVDLRGKIEHWSYLLPGSLRSSFLSLHAFMGHGFDPSGWPSDQLHHRK
jgi:hypothetical protein